nr:YcxB family protein [Clostridium aestuarii]
MFNEGKNVNILGSRSLSVTEEGITSVNNSGESKTNWSSVEKITETKKHIYIYISAINAYIIPVRAFKNENEKGEFLNILKQYTTINEIDN